MIIVFGSINADLVFRLPTLPAAGQTRLADSLDIQPGGKGANQAVAAARDGAAVHMVGAVGTDPLAAAALGGLREAGVDLRLLRHLPDTPTGCASVCTDHAGHNQIAVAAGANARASADQLPDARLGPSTTLLLQMETDPEQTLSIIRRAHRADTRILLNLAPFHPIPVEALRRLSVLIVNEDEAIALADRLGTAPTAAALHAATGCITIRTLGPRGAEAATAATTHRIPAPAIRAIDTTAAGDCFVGVLAAALDRGQALPGAMHRACTAAALACTRAGSQQSLPTAAEIDRIANA